MLKRTNSVITESREVGDQAERGEASNENSKKKIKNKFFLRVIPAKAVIVSKTASL